jgi:hypothetical protein
MNSGFPPFPVDLQAYCAGQGGGCPPGQEKLDLVLRRFDKNEDMLAQVIKHLTKA